MGQMNQPPNANPVYATLVLLYLLETQPQRLAQAGLAQAQQDPPLAEPSPDVCVHIGRP